MFSGLKFKCQPCTWCETGRLNFSVWQVDAESLTGAVAWLSGLYAKQPAATTVSLLKQNLSFQKAVTCEAPFLWHCGRKTMDLE